MSLRMYDLAGADPAVRFSPYCWRIKMALAHKGLEAETIPWRFTEKDRIAFSGQGLVPVLQDWELPLNHLSALYPATRQLSPKVRALIDFLVAEYQPVPPWDKALAEAGLQNI